MMNDATGTALTTDYKRREQLLDAAVPRGKCGASTTASAQASRKPPRMRAGRGERRPPERGGDCQLSEPRERRKGEASSRAPCG